MIYVLLKKYTLKPRCFFFFFFPPTIFGPCVKSLGRSFHCLKRMMRDPGDLRFSHGFFRPWSPSKKRHRRRRKK